MGFGSGYVGILELGFVGWGYRSGRILWRVEYGIGEWEVWGEWLERGWCIEGRGLGIFSGSVVVVGRLSRILKGRESERRFFFFYENCLGRGEEKG